MTSFMKLDFNFDWEVLLEFELNEVTLYVMLLGIEHNILIANSKRLWLQCLDIYFAKDRYSVNILRILKCEESV